MPKSVRLYANSVGSDIVSMSLYHTAVNSSNLLASGVSPATLTGSGVNVTVADDVTSFYATVTDTGSCFATTSSIFQSTLLQPNKRYFNIINSGSTGPNTVSIISPTAAGPSTSSLEQTVNFIDHSSLICRADFSYPDFTAFKGWFSSEVSSSATFLSSDNPLTITQTTFTGSDSFYAHFEGFLRTYQLSASVASVNEGGNFDVFLFTSGVEGGTQIPYTVSGIQSADLDSSGAALTGSFTVNNQTGSLNFIIDADATTEGVETFSIDLNDEVCDPVTVTINDTSTTPVPTYALSATTPVDEGDTVIFTLTTTNVSDGTTLPFTISGISASDINESLTGNFTVSSNSAQTIISVVNDNTTEGSESMTLALDNGGASQVVVINDTSILVGGVTINSGSLTVSNTNITGSYQGTLAINYTVDTADVTLGTPRVWTGGQVKCQRGFLHSPLFYGIDPTEKQMGAVGTVSPGTYNYTSTVTWTGYDGTCAQHGEVPGTGSNLQQEAYCEIVSLGSGPESWTHVSSNITSGSDTQPIALTFA